MPKGGALTEGMEELFQLADNGMDLEEAWEETGWPTSWKNTRRRYTEHEKAVRAAAAERAAVAAEVAAGGSAAGAEQQVTPAQRTKASTATSARLTTHQVEVATGNQLRRWAEYVCLHKQTTL